MKLGNRELALPLIQGGMGVGVSMGGLAGAVAAQGAMGTLSTADAGWNEPDFAAHPQQANLRALRREVQRAKRLAAGAGLVAVNAMVATRQYADSVRTALEAGADAIVSGAGLPLELPALAEGFEALLAPIVSGPRAAQLICRTWAKRYGRVPDFVVLEGCQAGGHLGFEEADLLSGRCAPLSRLIPEVLAALRPFEEKFGRAIPLFCAGGVATGAEMARCTRLGAAGAQLATRFIATAGVEDWVLSSFVVSYHYIVAAFCTCELAFEDFRNERGRFFGRRESVHKVCFAFPNALIVSFRDSVSL